MQEIDEEDGNLYWDDDKNDERNPIQRINDMGLDGWQLATVDSPASFVHIYFLKRLIG